MRAALRSLPRWLYRHRSLLRGRPLATIAVLRGFRSLEKGKLAQARHIFESTLRRSGEDYRPLLGLARLAVQRGDLDSGLDYWQRALACLPRYFDPGDAIIDPFHESAECLLAMYRFAEAQRFLVDLVENRPDDQRAWLMLARAYVREGRISEALEVWDAMESRFPSSPAPAIGKANCLIDAGKLKDASSELESAATRWRDNVDVRFVSARLAFKSGAHSNARRLSLEVLADRPNHIAAYALLRQASRMIDQPEMFDAVIASAPESVRFSEAFLDEVLVPHYIDTHDLESYRQSLDSIVGASPTARARHIKARYLLRNLEFESAVVCAEQAIEQFPYYLNNYRVLLKAYQQTNQADSLESLKRSMQSRFGEGVLYPVLIELGAKYISSDLSDILHWVIKTPAFRDRYFSDLLDGLLQGDDAEQVYSILGDQDFELTSQETVRLLGIKCQAKDLALLNVSCERVVWSDFERNCRDYRLELAETVENVFASGVNAKEIETYYKDYLGAFEQFRQVSVLSRESYFEAVSALEELLVNIREKTPTSLIRLGDGEGNFLPYREELQEFAALDQRKIQHIWWGDELITGDCLSKLCLRFLQVIDNADVLGVPPPWRLIKENFAGGDFNTTEQYTRGNMAITELLLSGSVSTDKSLVSSAVSNDWYRWNLYDAIFRMTDTVSYISCHDLDVYLSQRYDLRVNQSFLIPAEHAYREMISAHAHPAIGGSGEPEVLNRIFPELFNEISGKISPLPGEVYLVAAGFLGKFFCDLVKRRGGIGIDIGSTADYWLGLETRRYKQSTFSFRHSGESVIGFPLAETVSGADS